MYEAKCQRRNLIWDRNFGVISFKRLFKVHGAGWELSLWRKEYRRRRKKEKKAWGGLPQSQRNPMVLFSSSVYAFARGHNHNVSCINALPYYKSLLFEALCVVTSLGLADPSLFHASFYSYFIFISLFLASLHKERVYVQYVFVFTNQSFST